MAEGRSPFEYGWQAVGLLFLCLTSYYSVVEGYSLHNTIESFASVYARVEEGERLLLPCKNNTQIDVVAWSSPYGGPLGTDMVFLDLTVTPPVRSGRGYEAGLVNITDNLSLVIHDVKLDYQNMYHCNSWDYAHDSVYTETTLVLVHKKGLPMITAGTLSTETTPKTDCPTDDMFKVVFGVSVAALALSWMLIPCWLRWRESRRAKNVFVPTARRPTEEEGGEKAEEH